MHRLCALLLLFVLATSCLAASDSGLDDYWEKDEIVEISKSEPAAKQASQFEKHADAIAQPTKAETPAPAKQASYTSGSLLLQALNNTHPLREGTALLVVILFVINIFTGRQANRKLALAWASHFCQEDQILDRNFAKIGDARFCCLVYFTSALSVRALVQACLRQP